jgi:CheY-like chemotaxis protein
MADNLGQPKILLVDDNPRVRSFVRPALEDAGYQCIEAEDGLTPLALLDLESPDLVVLDIMLSNDPADLSGLDVCKKIREQGLRIPVVFLTIKDRLDDPRYMEQAFRLGADDYITKREELQRVERQMGLNPTEFSNARATPKNCWLGSRPGCPRCLQYTKSTITCGWTWRDSRCRSGGRSNGKRCIWRPRSSSSWANCSRPGDARSGSNA